MKVQALFKNSWFALNSAHVAMINTLLLLFSQYTFLPENNTIQSKCEMCRQQI